MSNKLKKKSRNIEQKPVKALPRLSQCMIVKNEEENIEQALSWAKDIAFEQIVVDTGSNDKTVEIAEKMGAKVYHFEWINDFSAAKNYAIEQANGNWIAFLDADEYLSKEDAKLLYDILIQKSNEPEKGPDIIRTSLINIEENGEIISKILQDRVFRNTKGLKYQGSIHENISYEDDRVTNILILDHIHIIHTGYRQSQKSKKSERNIALLKEILQNNPKDFLNKSYLADSLYLKGEYEEAYELYYNCIQNIEQIQNTARKYNTFNGIFRMLTSNETIINKDISEISKLYICFTKNFPSTPDPDYYLAIYHYNRKDYENCISYMKQAKTKLNKYLKNPLFHCSCTLSDIHLYSGYSNFKLKQYHEALPCLISYQTENKKNTDSLLKILYIIQNENLSEDEIFNFIIHILEGLYKLNNLRDNLLCIKAAKILGMNKLIEKLKTYLSESDLQWLEA